MEQELQERLVMAVLARAARGEGSRLLGDTLERARATYLQNRRGSGCPDFWMEAPLTGPAGFDFHMSYDRPELQSSEWHTPEANDDYQVLVDWFVNEETGGVGLGFAHDLRTGSSNAPAVYVNTYHKPLDDNVGFFQAAGHPQLAPAVEKLLGQLPSDYETWYLGVFANRVGTPARVGCFLPSRIRSSCATDPEPFARELSALGFDAFSDTMLRQLHELAQVPLAWEIQFDVFADGHLGDVLSIDLCLALGHTVHFAEFFADEGLGGQAMRVMESWGVADSRWTLIPQACFARLVRPPESEYAYLLRCWPSFLKAKWVASTPQPAKVYLQCTTRPVA